MQHMDIWSLGIRRRANAEFKQSCLAEKIGADKLQPALESDVVLLLAPPFVYFRGLGRLSELRSHGAKCQA